MKYWTVTLSFLTIRSTTWLQESFFIWINQPVLVDTWMRHKAKRSRTIWGNEINNKLHKHLTFFLAFPTILKTTFNLGPSPCDVTLQPGDGCGAIREQRSVIRGEVRVLKQSLAPTHGSSFLSTWTVPAGSAGNRQPAANILTASRQIFHLCYT